MACGMPSIAWHMVQPGSDETLWRGSNQINARIRGESSQLLSGVANDVLIDQLMSALLVWMHALRYIVQMAWQGMRYSADGMAVHGAAARGEGSH